MKIILLQNVENVGKKYQVLEVKSGYARNFLIPQNLAKLATKDSLRWLESQKEVLEKEIEDDLKKAQEMASNLDDLEVIFNLKVGETGQLFESVNNVKISEKLKEMGFEVKKSHIDLKDPIKELGEFPVKITLDHNLEVEIKVLITQEQEKENE